MQGSESPGEKASLTGGPGGTAAVSPVQGQGMEHVWKEPPKVPGTSLPESWQVGEARTARGAPGRKSCSLASCGLRGCPAFLD